MTWDDDEDRYRAITLGEIRDWRERTLGMLARLTFTPRLEDAVQQLRFARYGLRELAVDMDRHIGRVEERTGER